MTIDMKHAFPKLYDAAMAYNSSEPGKSLLGTCRYLPTLVRYIVCKQSHQNLETVTY